MRGSGLRRTSPYVPLFLLVLTVGLASLFLIALHPLYRTPLFLTGFGLCFAAMLGLRQYWPDHWGVLPLLALAIFARATLLPLPPTDDLNRYVWEGKVQLHGLNPYAVAPGDSGTVDIRDKTWEGVNHKEFTTIYGPVAQLVFKASAALWYSPYFLKAVLTLADLLTLLLIISFLRRRGSRIQDALLYAINPLVLFSFAGEGHVEILMLLFLMGAALMNQRQRWSVLFVLLGCACAVKLTAVIYIPLFTRRDTLRYLPFVLVPALAALPFGTDITSLATVTARFATEFHFNGFVFGPLSAIFPDHLSLMICTGLFVSAYLVILLVSPDPAKACGTVTVAFLLTSPTAQSWYFTAVALFAALYPVRSWIALTGTACLSWLVIFKFWATGVWRESAILTAVQYLPPLVVGIWSRWRRPAFASPGYGAPQSLSVIVPVLNEVDRLRECLKSIVLPTTVESEIIVVDGGSTDATVDCARADSRVALVTSSRGRGIQIAEGCERSRGDLVVIVHADSRLTAGALTTIVDICQRHPYLAGGSMASRFEARGVRFALIALLNNLRSRFLGISFGDQVQFFRRAALPEIPRVKLMEDIEISLLLKSRGPVAVVPANARSSTRRWETRSFVLNALAVIMLTGLYLVKRRLGILSADNDEFYRAYYG